MRLRTWMVAIVLVATAGLVVACGGAQSTDGTTTEGEGQPVATADAGAEPVTPAGDAGTTEAQPQGAALVAERCVRCHDMAPINEEEATREQWLTIVNDMIGRGATLSEQERDIVVDYLASR